MPIKETGTPWFFAPNLSLDAKVLLIAQMNFMIQKFTIPHGCKSSSYVSTYLQKVKEEIKFTGNNVSEATERVTNLSTNNDNILRMLRNALSSSRQNSYCKDILNTLALHIRNEVKDFVITGMLNDYIDNHIDVTLK